MILPLVLYDTSIIEYPTGQSNSRYLRWKLEWSKMESIPKLLLSV